MFIVEIAIWTMFLKEHLRHAKLATGTAAMMIATNYGWGLIAEIATQLSLGKTSPRKNGIMRWRRIIHYRVYTEPLTVSSVMGKMDSPETRSTVTAVIRTILIPLKIQTIWLLDFQASVSYVI
jgi:hypothetical protein